MSTLAVSLTDPSCQNQWRGQGTRTGTPAQARRAAVFACSALSWRTQPVEWFDADDPRFARRQYHMAPAVVTLRNSSFFAAQFMAGPDRRRLSDRHGRLPILIVSQSGTALRFVMLAFAPSAAGFPCS